MLKKIIQKLLIFINDKPLPPANDNELKLIDELKGSFKNLPSPEEISGQESETQWFQNMKRLKELVLTGNQREFLRWDVIKKTMFVAKAHYLSLELSYLQERSKWSARWENAINEFQAGHPPPYAFYPKSSGNLIHQAYHLAVYEERIKKNVTDFDLVVEFGGGYGSMCRLFFNLGFEGKYIIFDLEPFSLLQKFYLKLINIPVLTADNFASSEKGVLLLSDFDQLEKIFDGVNTHKSLFLATWSISESPMHVRDSFIPLVSGFDSYLIAYQDSFGEVNNVDYFDKWKSKRPDINWVNYPIEQIPGSRYLMGKKV
jgi:hypothetical protein